MMPDEQTFTYQINWRSRSYHTGYHRGSQAGLGMEFRGNAAFVDVPDARRIDIRQTIRDPAEQVHVRVFNQRNPTTIYAACDMSASMQFGGSRRKLTLAAEIADCIAKSAHQASDPFAFIGFDHTIREEWSSRPGLSLYETHMLIDELRHSQKAVAGSSGMRDISTVMSEAKGLVFLISDFHMPLEHIEQSLNMLGRHQVVPVVLWDKREYSELPAFGFGTLYDAESGQQRTLFFRKALKQRFEDAFMQRKAALHALFMRYEAPPYFVEGAFRPDEMTDYFHQFSAA